MSKKCILSYHIMSCHMISYHLCYHDIRLFRPSAGPSTRPPVHPLAHPSARPPVRSGRPPGRLPVHPAARHPLACPPIRPFVRPPGPGPAKPMYIKLPIDCNGRLLLVKIHVIPAPVCEFSRWRAAPKIPFPRANRASRANFICFVLGIKIGTCALV